MREDEFLFNPFTFARLRHEPEMRIYKHDIRLDGCIRNPYMRLENADLNANPYAESRTEERRISRRFDR